MHGLTDSMDIAALLVVSVAKANGEITRDTREDILAIFEKEFGVSNKRAVEMFTSSAHLLRDVLDMEGEVRHVVAPGKDQFQSSHIEKLIQMMEQASRLENGPSDAQTAILNAVKKEFRDSGSETKAW